MDSLKVLDPDWPIREADSKRTSPEVRFVPITVILAYPLSEKLAQIFRCLPADEMAFWPRPPRCVELDQFVMRASTPVVLRHTVQTGREPRSGHDGQKQSLAAAASQPWPTMRHPHSDQ